MQVQTIVELNGDIILDDNLSNGDDYKYILATSIENGKWKEVLPNFYRHTIQIDFKQNKLHMLV